jgi:hypothetical protein
MKNFANVTWFSDGEPLGHVWHKWRAKKIVVPVKFCSERNLSVKDVELCY